MSVMSAAVCAQSTAPAVKGSVVDASTGKPVEYAGVTLTDTDNNTIASAEVEDGRLDIHTAREGRFTVTIMLLGYRTYRSDTLDIRRGRTADLGTIRMEMEESSLEEVVVTRDRSKVVYRLDRRVAPQRMCSSQHPRCVLTPTATCRSGEARAFSST